MGAVERAIAAVAPQWALRRSTARMHREMIQNSGYDQHGASRRKKSLAGWQTSQGSPDTDIVDNLDLLRERSRDLCMGEGLAIGALKTIRTNEVGPGLRLNSQIDATFLGLDPVAAQAWEDRIEREWAAWAGTKQCDAARRSTFGELQALARLSQLMSGDVFALLPSIPRNGDRYDLKVKLVEADVVCDPAIPVRDKDILGGVEVGDHGEPIAYHFADAHPGDTGAWLRLVPSQSWTRVPAFGADSGRPLVLHLMESDRPGQRRGVPVLAPVMEKFKQLTRYSAAECDAAVVSALFAAFVTTPAPQAGPLGQVLSDEERAEVAEGPNDMQLAPGMLVGLGPGQDVKEVNPTRPNAGFDPFFAAISKQIAVGLPGMTFGLFLKQFNASYSASRAELLEAWKGFIVGRSWLAASFCQPVYESFLEEAILRGYITAPGFFDDPLIRAAWCNAQWIGPTQGQLDPTKEVEAATLRVSAGFSTRTDETIALTGGDWWANNALRGREEQARADVGITGAKPALVLTPTDIASIATVDEGRASVGLPPTGDSDGAKWIIEQTQSLAPDMPAPQQGAQP